MDQSPGLTKKVWFYYQLEIFRFQRQTSLQVFNVMTHKLGKITSLGFNKLCIVSAGSDKTLKIVDFSSGIILYSLNHLHEGPIRKVLVQENRLGKWEKFSADLLIFLCRILTASNDKTACLLSIKSSSTSTKFTMKMECRLVGHLNTVCSVAARNNYALTGSVDKIVLGPRC